MYGFRIAPSIKRHDFSAFRTRRKTAQAARSVFLGAMRGTAPPRRFEYRRSRGVSKAVCRENLGIEMAPCDVGELRSDRA